MTTTEANRLISWSSTTGEKKCIIVVRDNAKEPSDIDYERLELCSYNSDEDQWKTVEKLDYVDEIEDVGIPEKYLD